MSFGYNAGSFALPMNDAKLMTLVTGATWNPRRSQLGKSGTKVIIGTCSPPDVGPPDS